MHYFIPFSELIVEQYPELLEGGLVPYSEAYQQSNIAYEIIPTSVTHSKFEDKADLHLHQNELQKN